MKQRFSINIFVLLVLMVWPFHSAKAQQNRDVTAASDSVARIIVTKFDQFSNKPVSFDLGSGFAVNGNTLVTNHHVVARVLREPSSFRIVVVFADGGTQSDVRILATNQTADLAALQIVGDKKLVPSVLNARPVGVGHSVFILGFPTAADDLRFALDSSDRRIDRVTQAPGSIVTLTGSDTQPAFYVNNVVSGGGNSGGPVVDQCGQVLAVHTASSSSRATDGQFRGGASSLTLMKFLRANNISFRSQSTKCVAMDAFMERVERERNQVETADREQQLQERILSAQKLRDARDVARSAYEAAREDTMLQVWLLLAGGGACGVAALLLRNSGSAKSIVITFGAGAILFAVLLAMRVLNMPSQSDFPVETREQEESGRVAIGEGELTCRPVVDESRYLRSEPESIAFIWRANACVGRGTQYTPDGERYEVVLVPDSNPVAVHYIFDPINKNLVTKRYLLSESEAEILRNARIEDRSCTTDRSRLSLLTTAQERVENLLPQLPNEYIRYECTPDT